MVEKLRAIFMSFAVRHFDILLHSIWHNMLSGTSSSNAYTYTYPYFPSPWVASNLADHLVGSSWWLPGHESLFDLPATCHLRWRWHPLINQLALLTFKVVGGWRGSVLF